MARVIQRRKAPPYLLIIFVFLFVAAAALAVHQYIGRSDAQQALEKNQAQTGKVAGDRDLKKPVVRKLMKNYQDKLDRGKVASSVVGQLLKQVADLTQTITGEAMTTEAAIARTEDIYKKLGSHRSLIEELRGALDDRNNYDKRIADLEGQIKGAKSGTKGAKDSQKALMAKYQKTLGERDKQLNDLRAKFTTFDKKHAKLLADAKEAWNQIRKKKDKTIATQTDRIHTAETEAKKWQRKYTVAITKIRSTETRLDAVTRPDGKILRMIQDDREHCYINLGEKDGVEIGFSFAVYPPTGIPKGGKNKGSLTVTSVGKDVSRCRMVKHEKTNPLLQDDLIANIAFDSIRRWKFVVEGHFDLHGGDDPSARGANQINLMLRRLGAEITDEVDVDVDFVVLGQEPPLPRKPEEDAPPQMWESWRNAVKMQKRYNDTKEQAKSLRIPILNTNKFVALTGYAPIKPLRDISQP